MRYEYDHDNYVVFSDKWTRGEVRNSATLSGDDYLALIASKTEAISLHLEDGDAITDPGQLTGDAPDALDWVLWRWFTYVATMHVNELGKMGEARGRRSLDTSDTKK